MSVGHRTQNIGVARKLFSPNRPATLPKHGSAKEDDTPIREGALLVRPAPLVPVFFIDNCIEFLLLALVSWSKTD